MSLTADGTQETRDVSEFVSVDNDELPAMPDEETKAMIQTTELREMTVEPGVMRVPVDEVTTAHNSEQWVVEMDHPVEDDIRFFLPKPTHGWSDDYMLVRLLRWYDILDADDQLANVNPYHLQIYDLYIEYDDVDDEWELIKPPQARSRLDSVREWLGRIRDRIGPIKRGPVVFYAILTLGVCAGVARVGYAYGDPLVLSPVIGLVCATFIGLLITDPEGRP